MQRSGTIDWAAMTAGLDLMPIPTSPLAPGTAETPERVPEVPPGDSEPFRASPDPLASVRPVDLTMAILDGRRERFAATGG